MNFYICGDFFLVPCLLYLEMETLFSILLWRGKNRNHFLQVPALGRAAWKYFGKGNSLVKENHRCRRHSKARPLGGAAHGDSVTGAQSPAGHSPRPPFLSAISHPPLRPLSFTRKAVPWFLVGLFPVFSCNCYIYKTLYIIQLYIQLYNYI